MGVPAIFPSPLRRTGLALWSSAYRLAEAELGFTARLPAFLARTAPGWPVAQTVAVDVGASLGVYARAFHRWCPSVIAVEPNAAMARHLRALALPRLRVVEAAAGAETGHGRLSDTVAGDGRHPTARLGGTGAWQQPCVIRPLTEIIGSVPRALVVKVDVEGAELDAVRGLGHLLALPHLLLIIESERRPGTDPEALFDLLARSGLTPWQLRRGQLCPAWSSDVPAPPAGGAPRCARLHGYRNNFLFLRGHLPDPIRSPNATARPEMWSGATR